MRFLGSHENKNNNAAARLPNCATNVEWTEKAALKAPEYLALSHTFQPDSTLEHYELVDPVLCL